MTGLSKTRGPLSGGSEISIIGENINIGSRQRVAIRLTDGSSIPCDITSRNQAANKYDYYMSVLLTLSLQTGLIQIQTSTCIISVFFEDEILRLENFVMVKKSNIVS